MKLFSFIAVLCVMLLWQVLAVDALQIMSGCMDGVPTHTENAPACHHTQASNESHEGCCDTAQCAICYHCSASFAFLVPDHAVSFSLRPHAALPHPAPHFYAYVMRADIRPPRLL